MGRSMEYCPACGQRNTAKVRSCKNCGASLGEAQDVGRVKGSSLRQGTSEVSGAMIVLIIIAVILMVVGFLVGDAITQTAAFAAAAVFAILARIAQAGRQHAEMMDELRGR